MTVGDASTRPLYTVVQGFKQKKRIRSRPPRTRTARPTGMRPGPELHYVWIRLPRRAVRAARRNRTCTRADPALVVGERSGEPMSTTSQGQKPSAASSQPRRSSPQPAATNCESESFWRERTCSVTWCKYTYMYPFRFERTALGHLRLRRWGTRRRRT